MDRLQSSLREIRHKAAEGGLEYGDGGPSFGSAALDTFGETLIGQLTAARQMPFVYQDALGVLGTGASWRASGAAIPVAKPSFAKVSLQRLSVGTLTVCSNEFFALALRDDSAARDCSAAAEEVEAHMRRRIAAAQGKCNSASPAAKH